jgi:predicted alpha/beta-hydrolase family hydrolase
MKKFQKILLGLVIGLLIIGAGGWLGWQKLHYPASDAAKTALSKGEEKGNMIYFAGDADKPLLVFYPGALVDAESYSVWANEVANKGYSVAIVKMPFDLAVLGGNRAEDILQELPHQGYIIGGHSLGGVMASRFATTHSDELKGVFFLASYPDEKGSLADTTLPVLSLTASEDEVLNQENYQEAKAYLPDTTNVETITGGNHAGFGSYGAQRGDGTATISNEEQQQQIADKLTSWLANL